MDDTLGVSLLLATYYQEKKENILVLASNLYNAQRIANLLSSLVGDEKVILFPADELFRAENLATSKELVSHRLYALNEIIKSKNKIVVAHPASALRYLPSPTLFKDLTIKLEVGTSINPDDLINKLLRSGYYRVNKIDHSLEFARRGDIIDIYSINHDQPIRLSLFDNEIESIAYFDIATQESTKKINEVKQLIEKNKEAYNAAVSELQLKQSATKSKLEQLTSDIDYEYDQKIVEANEKYENLMKQAQLKHDENLADIEENRKNQENEINAEFEGRRNELRYIKSTYRDAIKEKQNDVERKIGELKVQQKELENNIATITKNMADEKDSFNKAIDELSKDYEEQAAILTKEYEDKVTEINEQYVSRPSEDLKIAIERLNAKKQEYADEIARINSKKDETARISDQVIERYNKLRHEVDQSLNEKNSEYKKLYDECAQREYELNSDLIKKENELKEYQEEINVQIAGIREAKKQEIDNYVKKLDEKYEAEQAHYKEIQDAAAKRVENEILSLKSHLDTKKANIDSLLAEINNRKQAIEDENSNKYNMVLDETRKLQQEFDELVSANGLKISEYSKNLALKKEEYKNALDNIKESNRRAIEEKLQMVENFNSENREKISKIREEIIALGEQKNIESAKLEDYTNQKNASMEAIKKDTEDYIELIKNMIEGIADKFVDLEKQHKERVVRIKAEIAKTVSEYDDLIRLKPQLIDDANKEEVNLLDKTEEFKEKINKLESIHNEILKELENKREYAIQMINEEIDKLENEKPNKIKRYKDEISDISLAYEAMLKDEKAKQAKLKEDIESANLKTAQIEKNNEEELDKYEELFNKDKEELSQEYENDLKQTTGEYISKNKELTSELEKLVGSKESLALELTNLSKQFGIVDEDISNSVLALKKECNDKMEEIKQLYQNKLESNREELKLIDVMND